VTSARRSEPAVAFLAAALSLLVSRPASAQWKADGGVLIRGTIVTMDESQTVTEGCLFVKNGTVADILPVGAPVPAGAIEIDTEGGFIFPGMMNLHNHIAYNFLPLYPVPKAYTNRDQWPAGRLYEQLVNNPKNLITMSNHYNLLTEVLKYAEIKALVGGETTIQGSPLDAGSSTILVRNIEAKNFAGRKTAENVLGPDRRLATPAQRAKWQATDGVLIHLAEGIDAHAEKEYATWKAIFGSSFKKLVGIHSTGLTEADFTNWEATTKKPKVVWSPLSNLMLYGDTTKVTGALKHHALVSLGTDWSPSGSKSLIWELKVADQINRTRFNGLLDDYDLVALVTRNPAAIIHWEDKVGMIKKGMVADLVVLDGEMKARPYRNLIESVESNVQLVMVGGDPIYGDEPVLAKLKKNATGVPLYEVLQESPGGRPKALDLKRNVPKGQESLEDIKKALKDAVKLDPADLADVFNKGTGAKAPAKRFKPREDMRKWLAAHHGHPLAANVPATADEVKQYLGLRYPNAKPVTIDPLYEENDDAYWRALKENLFLKDKTIFDVEQIESFRVKEHTIPH